MSERTELGRYFVQSAGGGVLHSISYRQHTPFCGAKLRKYWWIEYRLTAEEFVDQRSRWGYCRDCPPVEMERLSVYVWKEGEAS